ncbi:MAG: hypothetical protein DSZ11_00940 [Sulfurovum sp.]|nr:MAG: hypothetical protein DSZ11_00940 [Sulfurovum sp.]
MLRLLFIFSILINITYAEGQRYFIQLGSFKDQRLLERNIANIPSELRSHIVVVKSNYWLIPFAYHTPNRAALYRKLSAYKRYFPDAIISSSSYILSHRVVLNYVPQKSYTRVVSRPQPPKIAYQQVPVYTPKIYQHEQYVSPSSSVIYHPETTLYQQHDEQQYLSPSTPVIYHPEAKHYQEDVYQDDVSLMVEREEESITDAPLMAYREPLKAIEPLSVQSYKATLPPVANYSIPAPVQHYSTPTPTMIPTPRVITNTADIKRYRHFSSKMLSGQHYYLAYKATDSNPNLLIKVSFGTHRVTYQPIIGDMQMADANYIVDNNRLYMYADNFSENGAYSKIEAQRIDHILVSSWAGGKRLNTLRYYFKLGDAKRYLNVVQSEDKLSETIEEEGLDYDWGLDL